MDAYVPVVNCRACGSVGLVEVLDLGQQALTGVFPSSRDELVPSGPLTLLWCRDCHLVQLGAEYQSDLMYGDNYGYRSGLNASMVEHLGELAARVQRRKPLSEGDVVLDIGSNDGTLLGMYPAEGITRLGIDPTAAKFAEFYPAGTTFVPGFFSADAYFGAVDQRASIITSISMFYDLNDPVGFARQVAACLADDGLWVLEQSYMPSMLRTTSYDTVCHEHLEYYSLENLRWILGQAGLRIIDVRFNRVNGGSFAVTAAHETSKHHADDTLVDWFLAQERRMRFDTPTPFRNFEARVFEHRADLTELIRTLVDSGKTIVGLGASTKGNVLLQFCGFGPDDIAAISDVNPDKHGSYTPGTGIPIVSEDEARAMRPDYFLVLPWHFREGIVRREAEFLRAGGGLIFPLPEIEIVGA